MPAMREVSVQLSKQNLLPFLSFMTAAEALGAQDRHLIVEPGVVGVVAILTALVDCRLEAGTLLVATPLREVPLGIQEVAHLKLPAQMVRQAPRLGQVLLDGRQIIESSPELFERYSRALAKSMVLIRDHPEVAALMYFAVSPEAVRAPCCSNQ